MPYMRTAAGDEIHLDIERNPDEEENPVGSDFAYGVWEKSSASPDEDEIVRCFPTLAKAEEWIRWVYANQREYLDARGLA